MIVRFIPLALVTIAFAGCAEQPGELLSTNDSITSASFNAAGAPTVEFSVPDMMCAESCAKATQEILADQPGAKDVQVNFETKTATVAVEEDQFDAQQAVAALVDHGFDHSTIKSTAATKMPGEDAALQ